jgi:alanine-synthesizing transaminase
VIATLGSKEGFANMAQAITAPGDVILCPDPTYPIHAFGFHHVGRRDPVHARRAGRRLLAGAGARGEAFHPEAAGADSQLSVESDRFVASLDFYKDVIAFARKHDIIVLSDLAYAEIYFGDNPPPSVLQVPGAWMSVSSSHRCRRPSPCLGGGWASRSAMNG